MGYTEFERRVICRSVERRIEENNALFDDD